MGDVSIGQNVILNSGYIVHQLEIDLGSETVTDALHNRR